MPIKPCKYCKKKFTFTHFNQKKCKSCLAISKLIGSCPETTPEEVALIRKLSQTYFKKDIVKMLNCSWSRIGRIKHFYKIEENARVYPKALVKEVSEYYSQHGFHKTIEHFPDVKVKSLERYFSQYGPPRQIRWRPHEHRLLAQMAGFISPSMQAKVFKRPRAHAGSIKSYWQKNRKHRSTFINGIPMHLARPFLACRYQGERIIFNRQPQSNEDQDKSWRIVLWTDLAKHCKPTTPAHIREAFQSLARFQQWLHGTPNVRLKIKKMMKSSTPEALSKLLTCS